MQRYAVLRESRDPNYARAFGWSAVMLAGGILWYWVERDQNAVDWDFDSWTARFQRRAYRYDSNEFPINWVWHPLAGAGFYGLARANDLNVMASTATSVIASFAWEFLLEFKERVSVNDTLVTPLAGIPLGEYFTRLARYLSSAPGGGNAWHKSLRWSVGLPVAMHDAWDGRPPPPADAPRTEAGWGTDTAADFLLGVGLARHRGGAGPFNQYGGFMRSRLTAIPGYLREGDFRFVFSDANITSLDFRADGGEGGATELDAEAVLAGVHRQGVQAGGRGLYGKALTAGTSVHYSYRKLDYDTFSDHVGRVGLPGLMLEGRWLAGRAVVMSGLRMHAEFASLTTPAYEQWQAQNLDTRTKSVLERVGYYYAWGGAGQAVVEARLPWLRLGASILLGAYRSRDGLDRKQERVEEDFPLRDRQLRTTVWLGFVIPGVDLYIGASTGVLLRRSRVPGITADRRLDHYDVHVGLVR